MIYHMHDEHLDGVSLFSSQCQQHYVKCFTCVVNHINDMCHARSLTNWEAGYR